MSGAIAFVLHAHLPYVRHPEHEEFLEERWLFEAITETYLPLIDRLSKLHEDHIPARLTMSFTPTLLQMLDDPLLQSRYVRHLTRLLDLTRREIERTRWEPAYNRLALFYQHRLLRAQELYERQYDRDLISAFAQLIDHGVIEPIASGATHAYFPLMEPQHVAIRAQIEIGIQTFEHAFGIKPKGFWIPECGFVPGQDEILRQYAIEYIVTDAHAVLFGSPRPKYGVYPPVQCPSGVFVFGRDLRSSETVWSATGGYPADADYREFYRDAGYDLEYEYVKPYINGDGSRANTGLKYHRITGATDQKAPYDPDRALEKAAQHAQDFLVERAHHVERLGRMMDREPWIVSPYDAELFGHWWFEGPDWLDFVFRKAPEQAPSLRFHALSDYFREYPENQQMQPALSSWGAQGYNDVWLNGSNDWIYRHLHALVERMVEAANTYTTVDPIKQRVLNQMAREVLLAQSSDWPFMLKTQTHTPYAYRRLQEHFQRFSALEETLSMDQINEELLEDIEFKDRIFPFLDYHVFSTVSEPQLAA